MANSAFTIAAAAIAGAGTAALFFVYAGEKRKLTLENGGSDLSLSENSNDCIYLDYNGTTPIDPDVVNEMMPYFHTHFGNPSSGHFYGKEPRRAVDRARQQILTLLGRPDGDPSSVWFTGCGTESDNLAIQLALQSTREKKPHIVTCNVEHPAIERYLMAMEEQGHCQVTYVPVESDGIVKAESMIEAIRPNTVLVTLMLANNESGALQPVLDVATYCRKVGVLFHTDAAQAAGKVSVRLNDIGDADMISLVGHKIGAPKGIACLYVRPNCLQENGRHIHTRGILLIGGGQEFGRRGGTENVPYIVGFGLAALKAAQHLATNASRMESMRSRLVRNLENGLGKENIRVNGPAKASLRLPNTLSVSLKGVHSGDLLSTVGDRVAASAGATCHSASGISSVLRAMQVPHEFARGTLRLSVGPKITQEEVDRASVTLINEALKQLHTGKKQARVII